jgi:hypothetical protein
MPTQINAPTVIHAAGNKPKVIEEFIGQVNSGTKGLSIARMKSPSGWTEPGQTPEFDEYTVVLRGVLHVTSHSGTVEVAAGQAIMLIMENGCSTAPRVQKGQSTSPSAFRRFLRTLCIGMSRQ